MLDVESGTLAVPEPALAVVTAALAARRPDGAALICVPTTKDAENLANDLRAFLGDGGVMEFPAWETLPFERMSPSSQTAGQRAKVLWTLLQRMEPTEKSSGTCSDDENSVRNPPTGKHTLEEPVVIVAAARALAQRLGPLEIANLEPVVVRRGDTVDMDHLIDRVIAMGYRREYQVEHPGEVSVRGGIVDIYPSTAQTPVRLELWGDEVERLTDFDASDQRSTGNLDEAVVFPCRELLTSELVRERARQLLETEPWGREQWEKLAAGQIFDGMESWMPWLVDKELLLCDLLDPECQLVLVDPRRIRRRVDDLVAEEESLAVVLARTWGVLNTPPRPEPVETGNPSTASSSVSPETSSLPRLHLDYDRLLSCFQGSMLSILPPSEGLGIPSIRATGWDSGFGAVTGVLSKVASLLAEGYSVTICASGKHSAERLWSSLRSEGLDVPLIDPTSANSDSNNSSAQTIDLSHPGARLVLQPLEKGCVLLETKVAILTEADLSSGRRRPHRPPRAQRASVEGFFDTLKSGDFVVHAHHGVAHYRGMVTRALGGSNRDYLLLEYRGGDRLYVPTDQIAVVTPYTGGETPTLSRMGGSDWARTKSKVRSSVQEIAEELVELYRKRLVSEGHAFSENPAGEADVDADFPYVLTPDQTRAINDVKADMERPVPMDRLVCGDVGFGKTEIAIRATARAVLDGRQVGVLVPTTLLARQHYETFSERFSGLAVRVEMLSRFLTDPQAREVENRVAQGTADVVIGTHRLLSDGVRFKNLGLLIVDEEQRFGVQHKEAIKKLATGVDVLTLTANPIPRTLEMSLVGIRELSLIRTPPVERQPILTYVGEYDERAVSEAVRRELLREGQVFFVHNRVRDIHLVAERLRQLVPEARVSVAHGQMDEGSLESVALDFWEQRSDVLVCTTIIESGIDIPTVNTLVVDSADHLGLGQLHQLRGRVGRSGQRAYAYFFYPPNRELSEGSYERLKAIGENTELGSGFKIAMRDLEMRGAGNLLGKSQSGHIAAVGYDLYVQMVSEAISELKGETPHQPVEVKLDLPVDAHLPRSYISRDDLRLEAYRRMVAVESEEGVRDMAEEWADRYGPLPPAAALLVDVALLRTVCLRTQLREVAVTRSGAGPRDLTPDGRSNWIARLSPVQLPASLRARLNRLHPKAIYKEIDQQLIIPLAPGQENPKALAELVRTLLPVVTEPAKSQDSQSADGTEDWSPRERLDHGVVAAAGNMTPPRSSTTTAVSIQPT